MKNLYFKFCSFRLKSILVILFASFLINSCKKDGNNLGTSSKVINPIAIEMQK